MSSAPAPPPGAPGGLWAARALLEATGRPSHAPNHCPQLLELAASSVADSTALLTLPCRRAKFSCESLCSVGVRMRDPLAGKSRPRYVLEVYNKQRVQGKGYKDFDETDAYITGCVARACGSAIAWVLGNMQNTRCSEFASAVLSTSSLKDFIAHSEQALCRLFNCEQAVLFWVDEEHDQLWRYPTEEEAHWPSASSLTRTATLPLARRTGPPPPPSINRTATLPLDRPSVTSA